MTKPARHSLRPAPVTRAWPVKLSTAETVTPPKIIGAAIAERAIAAGVTEARFDRGPYKFHGRVAELANAAREGGLKF